MYSLQKKLGRTRNEIASTLIGGLNFVDLKKIKIDVNVLPFAPRFVFLSFTFEC